MDGHITTPDRMEPVSSAASCVTSGLAAATFAGRRLVVDVLDTRRDDDATSDELSVPAVGCRVTVVRDGNISRLNGCVDDG